MTELSLAAPKPSAEPGRLRRLFRWLAGDLRAALAILVLLALVIVAVGAPWIAPRTIRLPSPGIANTASMTTVAASMRFTSRLMMVNKLTLTFFSPCCQRMRVIERPLACNVRTYCEDSTSSSDPRNCRATSAMP